MIGLTQFHAGEDCILAQLPIYFLKLHVTPPDTRIQDFAKEKTRMDHSRLSIAKTGESFAATHLKTRGYKILAQNYRAVRGEIDIVAQDGDCIVFVEVKTRRSLKFGAPQAAVTTQKQRQISKVAMGYLQAHNRFDAPCRFDVIAIHLSPQLELLKLEQIENAFAFQANVGF